MNEIWTKLVALFPAVWCAWVCVASPIVFLIVLFLLTFGGQSKGTTDAPAPHKHNWRNNTPAGDPKYKTRVTRTKHADYGVYTWREKCDDCGEERDRGATGSA